jgi:hypothetical protein
MLFKVMATIDSGWQQHLCTVHDDFYHLSEYLELAAKRYNTMAKSMLSEDREGSFFLPYLIRKY